MAFSAGRNWCPMRIVLHVGEFSCPTRERPAAGPLNALHLPTPEKALDWHVVAATIHFLRRRLHFLHPPKTHTHPVYLIITITDHPKNKKRHSFTRLDSFLIRFPFCRSLISSYLKPLSPRVLWVCIVYLHTYYYLFPSFVSPLQKEQHFSPALTLFLFLLMS